jgi:hypothetical protein
MSETETSDRLTGHDDVEHLHEWGMILAERMAERHHPECFDDPLCEDRLPLTPLHNPELTEYFKELKELADAAVREAVKIDPDPDIDVRAWSTGPPSRAIGRRRRSIGMCDMLRVARFAAFRDQYGPDETGRAGVDHASQRWRLPLPGIRWVGSSR